MTLKYLLLVFLSFLFTVGFDFDDVIKKRPDDRKLIFDYAGILKEAEESTNKYLAALRDVHGIEALIVSLPSGEGRKRVEDLAVEMMSTWGIGRRHGGRGLLLLFVNKEKQVKLEVSYELEDVFTDGFCGYIEELQLKPRFLSGQLGVGLVAVMEELASRAQIKKQGGYTKEKVSTLDRELLSGGAGAKRDLLKFQKEPVVKTGNRYPAGATPAEAWETLRKIWRDRTRDPDLGVYTEICKLVMRDFQSRPISQYEKKMADPATRFEIFEQGQYAYVSFGTKFGSEAPFLLCNTGDGWKWDMVNQRKFIRYGMINDWGVERTGHELSALLQQCGYWEDLDIPLEEEDIYRPEKDALWGAEYRKLEELHSKNPGDFEILMSLGRLAAICAMGPNNVSILTKAKQMNPKDPRPYKYLAIATVDAFLQHETGIKELQEYLKLVPHDVFARNYLGYLYYMTGKYDESVKELTEALRLKADNCYACCYLTRCYTTQFLNSTPLDPSRNLKKNMAIQMYARARNVKTIDELRLHWLELWLKGKGILTDKE